MSRTLKFRHFFRDLNVTRLWSVWTRSYTLSSVVKRCRRDRGVREMLLSVQTLFRSKRTLLLSVTAAYKNSDEESGDEEFPCYKDITDEELESLTTELESVDELSRLTLYCTGCGRRLAIDKRYDGVCYCSCKNATAESSSCDGWVPYMEADDVIIWRKEHKSGQRYAYKVYGRYPEVVASDFAAVQVDGRYRKSWDAAVAALSTVEDNANGVRDQTVLHWEVMWPRMFSNRDYVYIRRHKQYNAQQTHLEYKDKLFTHDGKKEKVKTIAKRPSVHSNAKRKAMESEINKCENKVYVIISKSCVHADVPETKNVVRVKDYWSKMVVKSLHGTHKPGMEFILTYYDDAGSGGLPGGVTAWATGRAAPAYLARMRRAAIDYKCSPRMEQVIDTETEQTSSEETTKDQSTQTESITVPNDKTPEIVPPIPTVPTIPTDPTTPTGPTIPTVPITPTGPTIPTMDITNQSQLDTDNDSDVNAAVKDEKEVMPIIEDVPKVVVVEERKEKMKTEKETVNGKDDNNEQISTKQEEDCTPEDDDKNQTWWRYLYPFYYFL